VGYNQPPLLTRKIRLPSRLLHSPEILPAAGADETEQKHLLKIFWPPPQYKKDSFINDFCEGEDAKCLAHFAPTQNAPNTKKPKRTLE